MIDFNLDEIIDRETRRARASVGSHHANAGGPRWQGPRADAVSPNDRPELRWPSQRHLVPSRCWNCGASRANYDTTPPYGLVKRGETTCMTCSRVVVRWRPDGSREIVAPEVSS